MNFETNKEVLDWYERQERTLTDEFIGNIAWKDVKNYPLDEKFIPVLLYMRDIEVLTDIYYAELRRTPTGKDPIISKFMERWGIEEITHGEVINRFLNEAGIDTEKNWKENVQSSMTVGYTISNYLISALATLVGRKFTATHMVFGAIHEMTTTIAYRRLAQIADHPVLSEIMSAIIREESAHTTFYRSVARIELKNSEISQKFSRFIVKNFYIPVGSGSKPKADTGYTLATLFSGENGMEMLTDNVTPRVQSLPGFDGITKVSDKIGAIVRSQNPPNAPTFQALNS